MTKKIYFSDIDKDIKRILGKRLYEKCEKEKGFIVTERSNGDAEYHLNDMAYRKLKIYMYEHRKSRLYRSWTKMKDGFNVRFEIDSWT